MAEPAPNNEPAPDNGGAPAPDNGGGAPAPDSGGGAPASDHWTANIQDESLRSWASNKGWQDVTSAVKSAHELEKMIGAPADEVVRIPQNADEQAMANVMSKLGMPDSPDGYELKTMEGVQPDENFQNWFKNAAHKAQLTKSQAAILQREYDQFGSQTMEQSAKDYQVQVQGEDQELQREWGNAYESRMNLAKQTANALGMSEGVLNALESEIGYKATMQWVAQLGEALGEDRFRAGDHDGGPTGGFHSQMSPDQAKEAWRAMTADAEKMKALSDKMHPHHKQVLEEKQRIFSVMYPE